MCVINNMKSVWVLIFLVHLVNCDKLFNPSSEDSYLNAYAESQSNKSVEKNDFKTHREFISETHEDVYHHEPMSNHYGPPNAHYGPPDAHYGPANIHYGPPDAHHGSPNIHYGPPDAPHHGPPNIHHGPPAGSLPKVVYGSPIYVSSYGSHPPVYGPPPGHFYGMPHSMLGFFDKLKFKFDLLTIGKIILKVAIFKKLATLLGIICLLLFLPTLKDKLDPTVENGNSRGIATPQSGRLDGMTYSVLQAIDNFNKRVAVSPRNNSRREEVSYKKT